MAETSERKHQSGTHATHSVVIGNSDERLAESPTLPTPIHSVLSRVLVETQKILRQPYLDAPARHAREETYSVNRASRARGSRAFKGLASGLLNRRRWSRRLRTSVHGGESGGHFLLLGRCGSLQEINAPTEMRWAISVLRSCPDFCVARIRGATSLHAWAGIICTFLLPDTAATGLRAAWPEKFRGPHAVSRPVCVNRQR